jgi:membrane-associated protease RseP (regulator of RpoE activity)
MKSKSVCLAGLGWSFVLATLGSAAGDEPVRAETAAAINAGQLLVQLQDDGAAGRVNLNAGNVTLVDLANSLVAANGLGIDLAPPEAALRTQLGLAENRGLVVIAAPEESRGVQAGLKVHDIIVRLNEHEVGGVDKFRELLDASEGQPVKLRLLRQGELLDLEVTPKNPLVARVAVHQLWNTMFGASAYEEHYRIGVTLSGSDETLRRQLRLAEGEGLVVTDVVADSAATAAGIQKHDVLIVLDGKRLTTVEAINSQIQEIKEKSVELRLLRGGKEMTLAIAPRKQQEPTLSADNVVVWETESCLRCHANPHQAGAALDAHRLMAIRLRMAHSAWTDGHRSLLLGHALTTVENVPAAEASSAPQQQVEAIKTQLAEMQKAISALEAALKPADAKDK